MIADVRQMLDATVVMLLGIARDTQSDSLRHLLLGGGENEAGARKRELGGLEDLRHFIERESASAQDETTEFALRMQEDREALGSSKLFGACGKRALNFTEHERGVCVCVCVVPKTRYLCTPFQCKYELVLGFFLGSELVLYEFRYGCNWFHGTRHSTAELFYARLHGSRTTNPRPCIPGAQVRAS